MRAEDRIASSLQLAMLLEVSAYPKPGNVHRTQNFRETKYEHFLSSAAALGSTYRWAARRGVMISKGTADISNAQLGKAILMGVENMMQWQIGGNTSLGTIMMLIPIAVSAGLATINGKISIARLRANIRRLLQSATYVDSLDVFKAISAASPGGIGSNSELDVMSSDSLNQIRRNHIRLLRIFKMAAQRDSIASEWTTGYKITFEIGHPYFGDSIKAGIDMNATIVDTFLQILAEVPDTLIARKVGFGKAQYVSSRARECLDAGAMTTEKGVYLIKKLDRDLGTPHHELNPGTTADILSAVLAIALLEGFKV